MSKCSFSQDIPQPSQRHCLSSTLQRECDSRALELEDLSRASFEDADTLGTHGFEFTLEEENAVVKKLDQRIVLLISSLYLLSFLDRSNIGNAKIAGLTEDLHLTEDQYEWLLTGFYASYITFEWMALLFRLIPPHVYISVVVLCWGIISSSQALSYKFSHILVLRILLGLAEAAFTGIPFYLSFFYRRDELALRTGLFISAAPLATTFAGSLAWVITFAAKDSKFIAPWRLLFLVEGFPSVFASWYCLHSVPDGPSASQFLDEKEKKIAVLRLDGLGGQTKSRRVSPEEMLKVLKDPKSYLMALMFFCCNVAFSSMPVFLPTIIQEMGFGARTAQALSAPPYLVSFLVMNLTAYLSDRHAIRSPYLLLHCVLATSGYTIIVLAGLLKGPIWLRYLGLYPACAGFFAAITIIIAWQLNNEESATRKGAGIALLQFLGQCGPLVGTRLFHETDGPLYTKGMAVCAGCMAIVGVLTLCLRTLLKNENERRRKAWQTNISEGREWRGIEVQGLLDRPGFVKKRRPDPFLFML